MEKPLISIVIPVYNTAKFIDKCILSARAQKYPNLEIVVVNNGSTDTSWDIIEKHAHDDSRIKAYTIEHVPTVKQSRDNCFYRADGEFIIPVDSDDSIAENYVENVWNRQYETDADFVGTTMVHLDTEDKIYMKCPVDNFDYTKIYNGKEAVSHTIGRWEFAINGALMRKQILCNNSVTDPNFEDFTDEYDSRLFLLNCKKVAFCRADYLYLYNPNSVGKSRNFNREKYLINTVRGLLPFIGQNYGRSVEYKRLCGSTVGVINSMLRFLRDNKNRNNKNIVNEGCGLIKDTLKRFQIKYAKGYGLKLVIHILIIRTKLLFI